jgi:hypothetical protein
VVERGVELTNQERRLMLDQAIATGRGVFLRLTAAQYATLNTA